MSRCKDTDQKHKHIFNHGLYTGGDQRAKSARCVGIIGNRPGTVEVEVTTWPIHRPPLWPN